MSSVFLCQAGDSSEHSVCPTIVVLVVLAFALPIVTLSTCCRFCFLISRALFFLFCFNVGGLGRQGRRDRGQEPGSVRQLLVLLHYRRHGGSALHQVRRPGGVERAGARLLLLC